jgi:hypothetical protein
MVSDADFGTGPGIIASLLNSANSSDVLSVTTAGLGAGITVSTTLASNANPAVKATSGGTGPAVRATGKLIPSGGAVTVPGNAAALDVHGKASFTRSGLATIPAGASSIIVGVPGGLTAASHILATLQTRFPSGAQPQIQSAVPDLTTGRIRIYLMAAVPAAHTVKIGWLVFG